MGSALQGRPCFSCRVLEWVSVEATCSRGDLSSQLSSLVERHLHFAQQMPASLPPVLTEEGVVVGFL